MAIALPKEARQVNATKAITKTQTRERDSQESTGKFHNKTRFIMPDENTLAALNKKPAPPNFFDCRNQADSNIEQSNEAVVRLGNIVRAITGIEHPQSPKPPEIKFESALHEFKIKSNVVGGNLSEINNMIITLENYFVNQ